MNLLYAGAAISYRPPANAGGHTPPAELASFLNAILPKASPDSAAPGGAAGFSSATSTATVLLPSTLSRVDATDLSQNNNVSGQKERETLHTRSTVKPAAGKSGTAGDGTPLAGQQPKNSQRFSSTNNPAMRYRGVSIASKTSVAEVLGGAHHAKKSSS